MFARKRMYFMLPDASSARNMLNALLLARIPIERIRFWAKEGRLPEDLPDASFWHKTDLAHGGMQGMIVGGVIGIAGGIWLVAFPPEWVQVSMLALLVTTFAGMLLGGWMSSMAAASLPNTRLRVFHAGIAEGNILLIVDVPFQRVKEIQALLGQQQPDAVYGGVEVHIPVFP